MPGLGTAVVISRSPTPAADTPIAPTARGAVFFDLYGTLIDIQTDEADPWVYATLAQYLGYLQVAIHPEELQREYRSRVRARLDLSPERFPEVDVYTVFHDILTEYRRGSEGLGGLGWPCAADAAFQARSTAVLFRSLTRRQFTIFPDVLGVLERLQTRYPLGLISDAQWVFTDPELEVTGLSRFFPIRILSSRIGVRKPDERIFTEAMKAVGAAPQTSVYIGDNPPRDLVGARNAGMKCILFRGAGAEYNGLSPDARFQDYAELESLIDSTLTTPTG